MLLATACGSTQERSPLPPPQPVAAPQAPLQEKEENPGHTDRVYRAQMQLVINGALELSPEPLTIELRVVEILGGRHPQEVAFYSVSPNKPVELPDGRFMLFSADLSPGIWRGPGRYELSEDAGVSVGGQQGISSGAYIQVYSPADPDSFRRYDRFGEPCVLNVTADDLTGTVDCPRLLNEDDEAIELHWTWARL